MALKGDLASVDLAQVFQMLAMNQKVGLLSVQAPRTWRALYFDPRGVTLYYNEHTLLDRALAQMLRSNRLTEETVHDVREHASQSGMSTVDALLAGGYLTEEELDDAFRLQMEEEVYDLFFWRDARFEFYEGASTFEGREGIVNERFFFSTDSMIMEAARRIDEWSFIQERVPGPTEIYRVVESAPPMDLEDAAASVYDLVDGKRNVQRLVQVTGMSAFHVYKGLAQLLDLELIQLVAADDYVPAAQDCVAEGRLQDAIHLFEKAIELSVGLPETQHLAAQTYEALQEYESASLHLKQVAEHHVERGDTKGATEILLRVIRMLPTDLGARERLLELTIGTHATKDGEFDPIREGKLLVDLYLEIGEIDRVRGILERLLRDNPNDLDLKKSLINVHTKANDTRRVIELYESIAADLVAENRPIEAVKYLQKILMIDRSRRDVSEQIRGLYELDERRRSRRRTLAALGGLFCVLAALAGVWWFYEQSARENFVQIDVDRAVEAKNFEAAIQVYRAFSDNYPFTIVAQEAQGKIVELEARQAKYEADLAQEKRAQEARLEQLRSSYRLAYEKFTSADKAKDLDAALEAIENVKRIVEQAGRPEDQRWATDVNLEAQRRELAQYISDAVALDREARELMEAGDWRKARERLRTLVTGHALTQLARNARIPILLASRPNGAEIHVGDARLTKVENGVETPLVTPAVVLVQPGRSDKFELRLAGFEPAKVTVDPLAAAESWHTLSVLPDRTLTFQSSLQTPIGIGRTHLAGGLRGGRLGIARTNVDAPAVEVKLPGLAEVVGAPASSFDRIVFRTNEEKIVCHQAVDGRQRWQVSLTYPALHDPIVRDGRVVFGDVEGRILCLDFDSGALLWFRSVEGRIVGIPTLDQRTVRVVTSNGAVVVVDVADGRVLSRHRFDGQGTTGARPFAGGVLVGTADGRLIAMSDSGDRVLWTAGLGRAVRDDEIAIDGNEIYVLGSDDRLLVLATEDGRQLASTKLPNERVSGPLLTGERVYLTVRGEALPKQKTRGPELLLAMQRRTLEVVWEFRDGGAFAGPIATDGAAVWVPGSRGEIHRLR